MRGFHIHMQARCIGYQRIMKMCWISISLCFGAILMALVGSLIAALCKKEKVGGLAFGLYLVAALFGLSANVGWAVVTDVTFKELSQTAWYPYPSLAPAWYVNLIACILLLFGSAWYGVLVL